MIHTFFDGCVDPASLFPTAGMADFLRCFCTKVPEGFTIASVMLASGRSRNVAWFGSVLLGVATMACSRCAFRHHVVRSAVSCGGNDLRRGLGLIPEVNGSGVEMALVCLWVAMVLGWTGCFTVTRRKHFPVA